MNHIYRSASITLIDGTGHDPTAGLAGVSAPRSPLTTAHLNDEQLVLIPKPRDDISKSPWAMRGWTYQEGLLSRRRLVFTQSQLYFQCLITHCCECLSIQPGQVDDPGLEGYQSDELGLQVFPKFGLGLSSNDLTKRLNEYLRRNLSYDSDALNAFLGVLQAYNDQHTVHHIWGLPVQLFNGPTQRTLGNCIDESLFWEVEQVDSVVTRRRQFPSWTWAAYKGVRKIGLRLISYDKKDDPQNEWLELSAQARTVSGSTLNTEEDLRATTKDLDHLGYEHCLILTAWTTRCRFTPRPTLADTQVVLKALVQNLSGTDWGAFASILVTKDRSESLTQRVWKESWLVVIQLTQKGADGLSPVGLIVDDVGEGLYERVGTICWGHSGHSMRKETSRRGTPIGILQGKLQAVPLLECERREIRLV